MRCLGKFAASVGLNTHIKKNSRSLKQFCIDKTYANTVVQFPYHELQTEIVLTVFTKLTAGNETLHNLKHTVLRLQSAH